MRSLWRGVQGATWLKEEVEGLLGGEEGHRGACRPRNRWAGAPTPSYPEVRCALAAPLGGSQAPWLQRQALIQPPC